MIGIKKEPNTLEKLSILSQDSQYDLSCACGSKDSERRHRSDDNKWIYPVSLPQGSTSFVFKTLMSNKCSNTCAYCPLRSNSNTQRCTLSVNETVNAFEEYYRRRLVFGLFLTSGVIGTPDNTMDKINQVAWTLRTKKSFKGFIHLKIIPGASDAAIKETVSLASAVSCNIEVPGVDHFKKLNTGKNYIDDVIRPIKLVSELTKKGSKYSRVKQTTQFVIGASNETDADIVKYAGKMYNKLRLDRIYFSAYQRGLGEKNIPGEIVKKSNADILTREHRLYQVDWLIRKYKFDYKEIVFKNDKNLSLNIDPKEYWAMKNSNFFPININKASKFELIRVPGFGEITVNNILKVREEGHKFRNLSGLGRFNKRFNKAIKYISF